LTNDPFDRSHSYRPDHRQIGLDKSSGLKRLAFFPSGMENTSRACPLMTAALNPTRRPKASRKGGHALVALCCRGSLLVAMRLCRARSARLAMPSPPVPHEKNVGEPCWQAAAKEALG
jgi:hypothetical protein